jgi:hypothetical protein
MCADNHLLVANRGEVGPWEKFIPIPKGGNVVALKSDHGKYVVAEKGGRAMVNKSQVTD